MRATSEKWRGIAHGIRADRMLQHSNESNFVLPCAMTEPYNITGRYRPTRSSAPARRGSGTISPGEQSSGGERNAYGAGLGIDGAEPLA